MLFVWWLLLVVVGRWLLGFVCFVLLIAWVWGYGVVLVLVVWFVGCSGLRSGLLVGLFIVCLKVWWFG